MDLSTKTNAILFLDRDRFDFYMAASGNILSLPFSENIVNAMDVVNLEQFETQIRAFVDQNKIGPANIMMILSPNIVFEKDIETIGEHEVEKFRDTVPFENIYTQSFPLAGGVRVIAVNRDLCDAIKNSFENLGFNIDTIVSYAALGSEMGNIGALDLEISQQIIKRFDSIKHYSFQMDKKTDKSQITSKNTTSILAKKNIRLYVMIGVFLFFLLILGFLIFR